VPLDSRTASSRLFRLIADAIAPSSLPRPTGLHFRQAVAARAARRPDRPSIGDPFEGSIVSKHSLRAEPSNTGDEEE
jgi:hypothetical protein